MTLHRTVLVAIAVCGMGPSTRATALDQESAGKAEAADSSKSQVAQPTQTARPIYLIHFDGKQKRFLRVERIELRERLYFKANFEGKGQYYLSGKDAKLSVPGEYLQAYSRLRGDRVGYRSNLYFEMNPKAEFVPASHPSEKYHMKADVRDGRRFVLTQGLDGTGEAHLTKAEPPLSDPTPPSYLTPKSSN
jgi:hypothetical protein